MPVIGADEITGLAVAEARQLGARSSSAEGAERLMVGAGNANKPSDLQTGQRGQPIWLRLSGGDPHGAVLCRQEASLRGQQASG